MSLSWCDRYVDVVNNQNYFFGIGLKPIVNLKIASNFKPILHFKKPWKSKFQSGGISFGTRTDTKTKYSYRKQIWFESQSILMCFFLAIQCINSSIPNKKTWSHFTLQQNKVEKVQFLNCFSFANICKKCMNIQHTYLTISEW